MAATYDFDVFISYSSDNRVWAERLYNDLSARNVPRERIFFDVERLIPGRLWESQLAANVVKARHLVVLWTVEAARSDWVREETIRFKSEIDPRGEGPLSPERRLFQLLLQPAASPVLSRYHAFTSLKDVDIAAGPGAMSPSQVALWNAIVTDLVEAVIPPVPGIPWPVAVFAATAAILPPGGPSAPPGFGGTFDQFLNVLGIPDYQAFTAQYNALPQDWKPFGSGVPMSTMLDVLLAKVNQQLVATQRRWQYVDLITTDFQRVDDEIQKLAKGSCLLIVDPLTLLIQAMTWRYSRLSPCFSNEYAAILWLTPFGPHQPLLHLRQTVRDVAQPHIERYYEPLPPYKPLPPRAPFARCALNLIDDFELSRMVLSAVAEMPAPDSVVTGASVLNVGET